MTTYTVGQKLWFVPSETRRIPREVEIKSIGRIYLYTLCGEKIDVNTLVADGLVAGRISSVGTAYLSKEDWQSEVALGDVWHEFRTKIEKTRRPPDGVTVDKITEVRKILFGGE